jgi:hypothetical protein
LATPESWRQHVAEEVAPADPVDRAILATRKAVFPQHGLMP